MHVLLFSGKLYGFYGEVLLHFKKKDVFKKFVFLPTHVFGFAPLQVLVAKGSYRRGFLANLSIDGCI